ncbi:hypothetical protein MPH_13135 [Macrophomina phaseolina MS6]|uniref:Uncharacterized protein n=1 Tax=Macrophomina phaseolina (strain MS6) TaxID=1126212 RepID=K2QIU6_MACPH|nr:hypothetical protein MPH_13135 [Macrophomina phaseolina MS6]
MPTVLQQAGRTRISQQILSASDRNIQPVQPPSPLLAQHRHCPSSLFRPCEPRCHRNPLELLTQEAGKLRRGTEQRLGRDRTRSNGVDRAAVLARGFLGPTAREALHHALRPGVGGHVRLWAAGRGTAYVDDPGPRGRQERQHRAGEQHRAPSVKVHHRIPGPRDLGVGGGDAAERASARVVDQDVDPAAGGFGCCSCEFLRPFHCREVGFHGQRVTAAFETSLHLFCCRFFGWERIINHDMDAAAR